jgi:hypothetical protein
MPTLADKIAFAENNIRTSEGGRWSLKGREWVRDEFWLPADGFKLWRHPEREACKDCLERIGEYVEAPADNPTKACACGGLVSEPVLVTILNLDRGDGKTFNLMGYSLATLFKARNKTISALWASEDQGKRIFEETWQTTLDQAPALSRHYRVSGTPPILDVPRTNSMMEVVSSSHRSGTGRRRTHIFADEARDIEARTITSLLPSTNAVGGLECPTGAKACVRLTPEDVERGNAPETCSACGQRLVEWWPRIILVSASGILGGTERDWLYELVAELTETPHPNYHLFTSEKWGRALNPRKNAKVSGAISDVFGKLPSTRHYINAEYGNVWTQKGEDVITAADIKRVMDRGLFNEEGTSNRAVGFLDTSTTKEKTSLVILAEDAALSTTPWEHVYLSYLEWWWPGHGALRHRKTIDDVEVKKSLEAVVPLFPNLVVLEIDPHAGVGRKNPDAIWPVILMRELRQGAGSWRRKIRPWSGNTDTSDVGWDDLIERTDKGTIRLQYSEEIIDEIKGVTLRRASGKRGPHIADRNREVMHRDITEAIANCLYLIKVEQARGRAGRSSIAERLKRTSAATSETSRTAVDREARSSVFGRLGDNSW